MGPTISWLYSDQAVNLFSIFCRRNSISSTLVNDRPPAKNFSLYVLYKILCRKTKDGKPLLHYCKIRIQYAQKHLCNNICNHVFKERYSQNFYLCVNVLYGLMKKLPDFSLSRCSIMTDFAAVWNKLLIYKLELLTLD